MVLKSKVILVTSTLEVHFIIPVGSMCIERETSLEFRMNVDFARYEGMVGRKATTHQKLPLSLQIQLPHHKRVAVRMRRA